MICFNRPKVVALIDIIKPNYLKLTHYDALQVRTMFARMLVFLCRASRSDGECDPPYVMEEKQLENNEGKDIFKKI